MILSGANMILTNSDLATKYQNYSNINTKITREVNAGRLIRLAQGLFETDVNTSGKYLAGRIYGPSYLSFEYALATHGLIPEAVQKTYTSATFKKRKNKIYKNNFGIFTYRDVPAAVFQYEVLLLEEDGHSYQIATPEKALCDKLYTLPPCKNLTELSTLLFEDLRIDEQEFSQLNFETVRQLAPLYRSTNLNFLVKYIRRIHSCKPF